MFLNGHERAAVGGAEILDVTASYELEIVEGSRADYEAGRQIRLAYTAKAMEERREALRNSLAVQWRPILARQVPADSTTKFDMKCVVEPLPQSSIAAKPSSLLIEDGGPVRATEHLPTPAGKPGHSYHLRRWIGHVTPNWRDGNRSWLRPTQLP